MRWVQDQKVRKNHGWNEGRTGVKRRAGRGMVVLVDSSVLDHMEL